MRAFALGLLILASASIAVANAAVATDPAPEIKCQDWTHNPNGSWTAGPHAAHVRSSTIFPGVHIVVGPKRVDLLEVLEAKCGKKH